MAELVQHDAGEQRENERNPLERGRATGLNPVGDPDPGDEQKERRVHIQADAGHRSDLPGPFHIATRLRSRCTTLTEGAAEHPARLAPRTRAIERQTTTCLSSNGR